MNSILIFNLENGLPRSKFLHFKNVLRMPENRLTLSHTLKLIDVYDSER